MMISSVGTAPAQSGVYQNSPPVRPAQLPSVEQPIAKPPTVDISDDAKRLALAREITDNPVAVAAVSDNAQVDQVAESIYMGQQAQRALETYSQSGGSDSDNGGNSNRSPVAVAAVSQNADVDEFAGAVYAGRQAQQALDLYQDTYSQAIDQQSSSSVDETA